MILTEEQIIQELKAVIEDADEDTLSQMASNLLGGKYDYIGDYKFEFLSDENYMGAFDHIK